MLTSKEASQCSVYNYQYLHALSGCRHSLQLDESREHEAAAGTEDAGIERASPPIKGNEDKNQFEEELHSSLDLSDMEGAVLQTTI